MARIALVADRNGEPMSEELKNLLRAASETRDEFFSEIAHVGSREELQKFSAKFLGRSSVLKKLFSEIGRLESQEEKKTLSSELNVLKETFERELEKFELELELKEEKEEEKRYTGFDVSLEAPQKTKPHRHPYSIFLSEVTSVMRSMGYEVVEGPYLEKPYYNFTAANIPPDHPAVESSDTFWVKGREFLLRTHTTAVQMRILERQKPPIAAIVPGFCFRHEATDARHDVMFMQCEGVFVDEGVTLSHLIATAEEIIARLFGGGLRCRVRPSHFPFVEPGLEIDVQCPFCGGAGCSTCGGSGWLEVFPAGMIHPNVLEKAGIDSKKYSGFAFGFGLTRLAMIKYGINDIRLFLSGSLKFLRQFR